MRLLEVSALAVAVGCLASCASSGPVVAPVTRDVGELQGETVQLVVGQVLDIVPGDLAVDSYRGEVADPAIAEFVAGREDGDAVYNPGVKALAAGKTAVVLTNTDSAVDDVTFTVEVSGGGLGGY